MEKAIQDSLVIGVMLELAELPYISSKWSEETTLKLCEVCDLVSDHSVTKLLMDYKVIQIVENLTEGKEHVYASIPRLLELLVNLLNNLTMYEDIHDRLVTNKNLTLTLVGLFSTSNDSRLLVEIMRYIMTITSNIPRQKNIYKSWCNSSNDSSISDDDSSDDSQASVEDLTESKDNLVEPSEEKTGKLLEIILHEFMKGQDAMIKLIFVLQSATSVEPLQKALEFMAFICLIPELDGHEFSHYVPCCEVIESVIEATEELKKSNSESMRSVQHFSRIIGSLSKHKNGSDAIVLLQPLLSSKLSKMTRKYYKCIVADVIAIHSCLMVDHGIICTIILDQLLWVVKKTKFQKKNKSWDDWTNTEDESSELLDDETVAETTIDYLRNVLKWHSSKGLVNPQVDATMSTVRHVIKRVDDLPKK